MNQPKIYLFFTMLLLFVIFLLAYNRTSNSQTPQPQDSLKPLNIRVPQSTQSNSNSTDSWTLDFPDETGVTERRIIPSFPNLSACRVEGNKLSPKDYFCSRNCKSVNVGGASVGQELCDVSCTATRCNYVDTGKPYTE